MDKEGFKILSFNPEGKDKTIIFACLKRVTVYDGSISFFLSHETYENIRAWELSNVP